MLHAERHAQRPGLLVAACSCCCSRSSTWSGVKLLSESNTRRGDLEDRGPGADRHRADGCLSFHRRNFTAGGGFAPYGAHGIFAALPAGVVFALQGFEQAIQMGGEARNPQRDLSRAVITAMLIGTVDLHPAGDRVHRRPRTRRNLADGWANPVGAGRLRPVLRRSPSRPAPAGWPPCCYIDAVVSPAGTGLVYVGTSARLSYALGEEERAAGRS